MNLELVKDRLVDLQNDEKFEKLASFATEGTLSEEDMATDIGALLEKQAYADDSTYADPVNRMFSIASPIEAKLSALYAEKCASLLDSDVVNRINDACKIYDLGIEVPVLNKVAYVTEDKAIMDAIDVFDAEYKEIENTYNSTEKYASCKEYGNQLDTCLAARAFYATEPEDVEAIENLAKIASSLEPEKMVEVLKDIDEELGLDNPRMQSLVGSPEYAVYEKVASENMVDLGSDRAVPLDVIEENKEVLASMGVNLDWDGESGDALTLQIENLPSQIKEELAGACGMAKRAACEGSDCKEGDCKEGEDCKDGECGKDKKKEKEEAPEKAVKVEINMDGDVENKSK